MGGAIERVKFKFNTNVTTLIYCRSLALTQSQNLPQLIHTMAVSRSRTSHPLKLFWPWADAFRGESLLLYTFMHSRILSAKDMVWAKAHARLCHALARRSPIFHNILQKVSGGCF